MSEDHFDQVDFEIHPIWLSIESQMYQMDRSFEDLQRMLDTYNALTEWAGSGDKVSTEAYTPVMLKLALAGTDIDVDQLSTESAVEVIKALGKAIIDLLRKLITGAIDAISNFDLVSTWMLRNVNLLERKRKASLGKVPKEKFVTLGANHRYLRVGRIFADSPTRLRTELKVIEQTLKIIGDEFATGLQKGGSALQSRTSGKKGSELEKALLDCVEDIGMSRTAMHLKMSPADKDRWGRSNVQATPPLIGGKSIFYFQGDLGEKGVRALRFHGLNFSDTFRAPLKVEDGREFVSLTTSDLAGLPEQLRSILLTVSNASGGRTLNALKQLRTSMEQFVTQRANMADTTEEDMRMIRSTVNAFTGWSRNVIGPLYSNSLSVCRAVMAWAQASTKTYH